jgi:hypothetical protein
MMRFLIELIMAIIGASMRRRADVRHSSPVLRALPSRPTAREIARRYARRSGMMLMLVIVMSACSTEVLYARATQAPDEAAGMMRLAQRDVRVTVDGEDGVGEFVAVDPGAYLLVHEQDYAALVRAVLDETGGGQ